MKSKAKIFSSWSKQRLIAIYYWLGFVSFLVVVNGCFRESSVTDFFTAYSAYTPVLVDRSVLDSISYSAPRKMVNTGRIYNYGDLIFVNEIAEGFHVINNSNPANPEKLGFLSIFGSHDMVINGSFIYSDNSTDLIAIPLDSYNKPTIAHRVNGAFPNPVPPDGLPLDPELVPDNTPPNTVIAGWKKR
jgi:hypothetical protein